MNNIKIYATAFFDELEVFEDLERGHCYKAFMRQAVCEFLDHETKETAFAVYRTFFDSYRITMKGGSNPFIDLLDVLKKYEENAAVLIDRQRDHYIHSVNVFILGLSIYARNANFRSFFRKAVMNRDDYPFAYDTKNEEFYYRWGIASLFHDVGYPVEIIGRQINKFVDFASAMGNSKDTANVQLAFENFEVLNNIPETLPKREFTKCYFDRYEDCIYIDTLKPIDLLAHKLHTSLGVDLKTAKHALDDFVHVMARSGFVDHGFYSAIIVLKWYGFLIQSAGFKPEYFFWPVLDSASAILLHNCYRNMMQKKPFGLGRLHPAKHPIAFLLILCDEMQEWNRMAYGIKDRLRTLPAQAKLEIADDYLSVKFLTFGGSLPIGFAGEKKKLLNNLLDMNALFDTVSIHCRAIKKSAIPVPSDEMTARPAMEILEKLARTIHELYNAKQLERYPDKPLKYPEFDDLPDSLKYSNLRQAMNIAEKIHLMGFEMRPAANDGIGIQIIPEKYVEYLAEREHDAWVSERVAAGWVFGDQVDAVRKISPYLIPYDKLKDEIKELDRDTIRNIPELLRRIEMKAVEIS